MHSTNYRDTFIQVAVDSPVTAGTVPPGSDTIAGQQYALLHRKPYALTSDDLLFEIEVQRKAIASIDRKAAREAFFAKPRACLRASPLGKRFGWGFHHDADGKLAMIPVESAEYDLLSNTTGKIVKAMRLHRSSS